MGNPQTDIKPMALLREELSSEDTHVKVNAIHRLGIIAKLMPPDQLSRELLPFLDSNPHSALLSHEEEVLFSLAQSLGSLPVARPSALLPLLETLAALDQTVVRDEAVRSIIKIASRLSDPEIDSVLAPILLKLSVAENFSARVSACQLCPTIYARSATHKERIRHKLMELSHQETPMVRRAAALQMGSFAKVLEKHVLVSELLGELRQSAQDEQDQIRILYIDSMVTITSLLSKEENKMNTLPIVLTLGEDRSWKVRYHFAKMFPRLAASLGRDITESALIQTFAQLLRDQESDVKAAALQAVTECMASISKERLQSLIFPAVEWLIGDNSLPPKVRKCAASALIQMSPCMGREFAAQKIVPFLQGLMGEDLQEVKRAVVEGLGLVGGVVGADMLTQSFVAQMMSVAKDSAQWRLREALYMACVDISRVLGKEVFSIHLQDVFFSYLTDSITELRDNVTEKLGHLAGIMGNFWVETQLVPKLQEVYFNHELGYLFRITVLKALCDINASIELIAPVMVAAAKDKVANVRFAFCKTVRKLNLSADVSSYKQQGLARVLMELAQDGDRDVRYFAQAALNEMENNQQGQRLDQCQLMYLLLSVESM